MTRRLTLSFDDFESFELELERRLTRGEATVVGVTGLDAFMPCELEIHHPNGGEPLTVDATVMTTPEEQERDGCVRLMLQGEVAPQLEAFVEREPVEDEEPDDDDEASGAKATLPPPLRLRKLKVQQQMKLARTSQSLTERTALERILGKASWEPLLANRFLTVPEVARIARKGTVPRPILEQIVNNQSWARVATIRRALLTNPKMSSEMIIRVLRLTPPHELKLILKQTAYPPAVRAAAERLFGRG